MSGFPSPVQERLRIETETPRYDTFMVVSMAQGIGLGYELLTMTSRRV